MSVDGRAARPNAERDQHADCSNEEEFTTTDSIDKLSEADGDEERPDLQTTVDERLVVGLCDPDALEDVVEVVRCNAVATALREEAGEDDE